MTTFPHLLSERDKVESVTTAHDLDGGLQISTAPPSPLLRHAPWQKMLKDTMGKLEKGDHGWMHLAMKYWPGRIHEKCEADRSLAVAHCLKDHFVLNGDEPTKTSGGVKR
ncbi:hypothetical protein [Caballeronia sordidicola]|uniref:hypothetical protein n=1 Tax=Caballeronia sordidicola TaxID=196367 RepID=UPI00094D68B1|nr:hypothetical protein [Caballeronia sordidicola]